MTKLILKQKSSNSGSIHDIRSDRFDLEIKFRKGCEFAVVKASYYNDFDYTTHKTLDAAISARAALGDYSAQVITSNGYYALTDEPIYGCEVIA